MAEKAIGWRRALSVRVSRVLLLVASAWLLFAGVTKAQSPQEFREVIKQHELLSPHGATLASMVVPWVEIGLGAGGIIAVMSAWMSRVSALAVGAVFLAFSVYALLISFDPPASPVPCGCVGRSKPVESWFGVAVVNGAVATMMCLGAISMTRQAPCSADLTR